MFGKRQDDKTDMASTASKKSYSIILTERDKKIIYLFVAVVLFIIAVILLTISGFRKTALQECTGIVLQQPRDSCLANLASSTSNISICSFIKNNSQYNNCVFNVADTHNSVVLCGNLNSSAMRSACIYNVSVRTSNESVCSMLAEPYESKCFYNYAELGNFSNLNICSNIPNSSMMQKCVYLYYYNAAIRYKSYPYCSHLPNSTNSTIISYLITQNMSNYENIEASIEMSMLNITPQDYCYIELANETKNISVCALTYGTAKEICGALITKPNATVTLNETTACGSVPSYLKNICEYSFISSEALAHDNVSECLTIDNLTYKDNCIYTIAYKYNNTSYCSYMGNATAMGACYNSVK